MTATLGNGKARIVNAIVCEDVRLELYNKLTLVGVYAGDIIMAEMPGAIGLAFYLELISPTLGTTEFAIQVSLGSTRVAQIEGQMDISDTEQSAILTLPRNGFSVTDDTVLTVEFRVASQADYEICVRKKIRKGDLPVPAAPIPLSTTSSLPPS